MIHRLRTLVTTTAGLMLIVTADARTWKNHSGKSFEADYISNDGKSVTLRRKKHIITFDISKLHQEDQQWIKKNHPADPDAPKDVAPPKGAAFDSLEFGDSKTEVIKKLRKSKLVDGDIVEAMIARVGMNGIYRTKREIGGLKCKLYFEWTNGDLLREVSLRTKALDEDDYDAQLKGNWTEWVNLLTMLYGKPVQDGDYPLIDDLYDGLMLGSHIWYTEENHSIILGTGQDGNRYSAVVRITSERITPNRIQ